MQEVIGTARLFFIKLIKKLIMLPTKETNVLLKYVLIIHKNGVQLNGIAKF